MLRQRVIVYTAYAAAVRLPPALAPSAFAATPYRRATVSKESQLQQSRAATPPSTVLRR